MSTKALNIPQSAENSIKVALYEQEDLNINTTHTVLFFVEVGKAK